MDRVEIDRCWTKILTGSWEKRLLQRYATDSG